MTSGESSAGAMAPSVPPLSPPAHRKDAGEKISFWKTPRGEEVLTAGAFAAGGAGIAALAHMSPFLGALLGLAVLGALVAVVAIVVVAKSMSVASEV